ncbi:hypothetical protein N7520_001051 [Penicillium odoratum]|uniref:uncharacterized protein n=1 Tax=Penicillium odoratum TaxID=1167516 RepID=UPI00254812C8|nr:uncharacterized protein N7520_001051 [Penicillium odoratum]KAJ5777805.1 hypothetical protein N7520_001051 [Penicillium odoratum]
MSSIHSSQITLKERDPNSEEEEQEWKPDWRLKSIFGIIGLLNFVTAVDATCVSVSLPTISQDLGGTATEAFWAGTSFLLASCVFQPIFSQASDIFGRKYILLLAVSAFTVGSILAAVSHGFTLLLVARCIQGTGGGGILALTEILIADLVPLRQRGKWFSIKFGASAVGTVTGPLIGGAFTGSSASWRWIFWFNLPFCGLGLLLIPILLQLQRTPVPIRQSLAKVDYFGSFLFVASLTSFLIPITWGGIMYSWSSWHTLVPLILGLAGLLSFGIYEAFIPAQPLIPVAIFTNATICLCYFGIFLHGLILWAIVYYIPLYYEGALGYRPIIAGVAVFPECLTVAPISVMTSIMVSKLGGYRWALWSGWPITALGLGLLCLLDSSTSVPKWIFLNITAGVGCGMLFPAVQLAVQAAANTQFLSMAVTMTAFFRVLGQSLGVAVGGVVFQNRILMKFGDHPELGVEVEKYAQDASSLVEYIKALPAGSASKLLIQALYAESLTTVWAVMCGIAGVGIVSTLFVKRYTLNQSFKSTQGLKDVEHGKEDEKIMMG